MQASDKPPHAQDLSEPAPQIHPCCFRTATKKSFFSPLPETKKDIFRGTTPFDDGCRQHLAHLIPVTAGYRSSLLQFSLTTPGPVHLSSATVLHHPTALSMLPADYSSLSQSFDMQLKLIIDKRTAIVNQQFRQIIWLYLHCRQNARLCTKQITDLFLSCLLHSDILFLQPLLHHLAQQLISHGEQRHTQQHA